jgi:hypothetical protein
MADEIELSVDNIRALASLQNFADDADLRGIGSYEDALALAEEINGNVIDIAEELGSGFALLDDKNKLVGEEFVLIQWRFSSGDYGMFVSAGLVTKTGKKYIINDGSSGIRDMLLEFSQSTKRFGGMKVPRGLRESTYATCFECGVPMTTDEPECTKCGYVGEKRGKGQTFYLDTSAAS